jgi:uncharacterized protein Yka (UPF0111/DUF47 family)
MKISIVTFLKGSLSMMIALLFLFTVSSCQKKEDTMEKAGKKVDETIGAAEDTMEKADKKIEESIDEAQKEMDDAAHKAGENNKQ